MGQAMREHYARLADTYDDNWAYSDAYLDWMAGQIAASLELGGSDRIADLGCGTGLYASRIAELVRPRVPVLCIDPSQAMLDRIPPSPAGLTAIRASGEELSQGRVALPYPALDAMWIKEAVHHFADPATALGGLAGLLAPGGRLLVAMLPATIAYPLFPAATARFEEQQPDPVDILAHLRDAGLDARLDYVEYELRIDRERYLGMVRSHYMSLLSTFTHEELEAGIEQIRVDHPESVLVFPDRFAFVLGRKPVA
jgi:SAM-dependent methyltransferase